MANDPGQAALCLADCPMSNPTAPSSLYSLCSLQGFCSLLCILMASSSLQDCISLSQGSTTTSVAAPRFLPQPLAPERPRRALLSTGSCQGHRDTKGSWAAHQLSLQGKRVGAASKSQEGSSPCFRRAKVSLGRCLPASSQVSVSPKSPSALRLTGALVWETSKVINTKKKGTAILQLLMTVKTFLLFFGQHPSPLCSCTQVLPVTSTTLACPATPWVCFSQVLPQPEWGSLAGISNI